MIVSTIKANTLGYGFQPIRAVIPVPEGFTGSLQIGNWPTQQEVCLRRNDNSPQSIEVIAIADETFTGTATVCKVESHYSPTPTSLHPMVKHLLLHESVKLCIEGKDGTVYSADLALEFDNPTEHTKILRSGAAETVLETTGGFVDGMGSHLGGFVAQVRAYANVPGLIVDFSWHTGFKDMPIGRIAFKSMWIETPPVWDVAKIFGLRGFVEGEKTYLIEPLEDDALHVVYPQTRYDGRFVIYPQGYREVASDIARDSGQGVAIDGWCAWNPDTPITLEQVHLPSMDRIDFKSKTRKKISEFMSALQNGALLPSSGHGRFGYRHPALWNYGGATSGQYINHRDFVDVVSLNEEESFPYIREWCCSLLDRTYGFLYESNGLAPDVSSFPQPINFVLSPGAAGWSSKNQLWPTDAQDPFGFRDTVNNYDPAVDKVPYDSAQGSLGTIDPAHFVRISRAFKVMVEFTNDEWSRRVVEDLAVCLHLDHNDHEPNISGYVTRVTDMLEESRQSPGKGGRLNRADGWVMEFMSLASAIGLGYEKYLSKYVEIFELDQMSTGFVQGSESGKEFKQEPFNSKFRYSLNYQEQILQWGVFCARTRVGIDSDRLLRATLAFHRFSIVDGLNGPWYKISTGDALTGTPFTQKEQIDAAPKSGGASTHQYGVSLGIAKILAPENPEVDDAIREFCWKAEHPLSYLEGFGISNLANHATLLASLS